MEVYRQPVEVYGLNVLKIYTEKIIYFDKNKNKDSRSHS
jgi:hypothetical protein